MLPPDRDAAKSYELRRSVGSGAAFRSGEPTGVRGNRPVKNNAAMASSAVTAYATWSASSRASELMSRMSWAVGVGDRRLLQGRRQLSVGEERDTARQFGGRPLLDRLRNVGIGLDPRDDRGAQGRDEHRSDERRPQGRAEVGGGVLQPADLGALRVGDGRHGDGAELGGQRTESRAPSAASGRPPRRRLAPGSIPATRNRMPTIMDARPNRTTRRGLASGRSLGIPAAASSSADGQRDQPDPGLERVEFEHDGQEQRDGEEHARLDGELGEEHARARRRVDGSAASAGRSAARRRVSAQMGFPPQEPVEHQETTQHQPHDRRQSRDRRARRAWRCTQPHSLERRTPNTIMPEADHRQQPIRPGRGAPCAGGNVVDASRSTTRMTRTITTSPAKTYRQDAKVVTAPPISGPAATAIAPAAATRP